LYLRTRAATVRSTVKKQLPVGQALIQIVCVSFVSFTFLSFGLSAAEATSSAHWWKGNLHTHSLWSDGDDYPEMVVDWYKQHGWHFLAMSEHNVFQVGERWSGVTTNRGGTNALNKYIGRFGTNWVEQRMIDGELQVRLQPLEKYRKLFEEAGRFLMIPSEEITDRGWVGGGVLPVNINVTNPRELIVPPPVMMSSRGGTNVLEVMQRNVNAVIEQRQRTGQPMFSHVNHPNFVWGITAEELVQVRGAKFFEVYNGHPRVNNEGDATHAGTDRVWDIVLTWRLAVLGLEPIMGIGVDDAHHYHRLSPTNQNVSRGWVMVRAPSLSAEEIIKAMESGDFYASSGVTLRDVQRGKDRLSVQIEAEPGVTYTTQFLGTRKGFDQTHEPLRNTSGQALHVTHRYSKDVGALLAQEQGSSVSYALRGDEIYVRAKIISSKLKANGVAKNEVECAWSQPLVTGVK